jgi:hypothetical protein
MRTPVKEATIKGNSLGNQLRREDILPPFSMFYSLPLDPGRALLVGAPERLAIASDGGGACRGDWRGAGDDPLSPGAPWRCQCVAVQMPPDRLPRRRTGGVVGQAQSVRHMGALVAPPGGDGAIAAIPTPHRTTGPREQSGEGMAFAPAAAKVWHGGEDLDEGLRLCYHDGAPEYRVLAHGERAGKARLPVG